MFGKLRHRCAMHHQLLNVKMVLPKEQRVLDEENRIRFGNSRMILPKLVWINDSYALTGHCVFSEFYPDNVPHSESVSFAPTI